MQWKWGLGLNGRVFSLIEGDRRNQKLLRVARERELMFVVFKREAKSVAELVATEVLNKSEKWFWTYKVHNWNGIIESGYFLSFHTSILAAITTYRIKHIVAQVLSIVIKGTHVFTFSNFTPCPAKIYSHFIKRLRNFAVSVYNFTIYLNASCPCTEPSNEIQRIQLNKTVSSVKTFMVWTKIMIYTVIHININDNPRQTLLCNFFPNEVVVWKKTQSYTVTPININVMYEENSWAIMFLQEN